MSHGGDIYRNCIGYDFSVSLNPCKIPEDIYSALHEGIAHSAEYPDLYQEGIRNRLSDVLHIGADQILAGNGASELLMALTRFLSPKKAVMTHPTYSGYRYVLDSLGDCDISTIELREDEDYRISKRIINSIPADADVLYISDPCNPTGLNIDEALLDELLEYSQAHSISVVLDESFYGLSDKGLTFLGDIYRTRRLTDRYQDLYILRSYTKLFSLPGIRMGYLVSSAEHISGVRSKTPEWNMSQPAAYAMEVCAGYEANPQFINETVTYIDGERAYLMDALRNLGYQVYPSDSVYLMFRAEYGLYDLLLKRGILIRDLSDCMGDTNTSEYGYVRIAVKDHASNETLIGELKQIKEYI